MRALFSSVEEAAAAAGDGSATGLLRTHTELEAELVGGHGPAAAAAASAAGAAAAGVPDVREQALQDQLEQMAARLQQRDAENQRLLEERNLAKAAALESREQLLSLSAEISAEAIERERCQSPVELSRPPLRPSPLRWIEAGTPPRIAPAHSDGRTSPDSFSAFSERSDPGSSFSGRAERTPVRTPVSRTSGSRTGSDVASASDITESDCTALTLHDIRGGGAAKPANIEKLSKLRLSDFDVICTIGHGPNGKVMRVQKKDDGAVFALKSIKRRRLLNEYDALGKLSRDNSLWRVRCPFVTRLHFAFESLSRIHLIVDAVDGGQLLLHLRQHWPAGCPEEQARFHAAEIVLGLEHLHAHGVTHGDLKGEVRVPTALHAVPGTPAPAPAPAGARSGSTLRLTRRLAARRIFWWTGEGTSSSPTLAARLSRPIYPTSPIRGTLTTLTRRWLLLDTARQSFCVESGGGRGWIGGVWACCYTRCCLASHRTRTRTSCVA